MPIFQLDSERPQVDASAFVAPGAVLVGKVTLLARASVWFNATLRGDNERITVGEDSNVQDGSVLHTDTGWPLDIARDVTVGHQAMLHSCSIGEGTLIGMQAIVLNRAVIGRECLVAAGALVSEGKVFGDGLLILGSPARVVRALTADERAALRRSAAHYAQRGGHYRSQLRQLDTP